jgi:hypothetical protein
VLAESEDFGAYFPHINDASRRKSFYDETCIPELTLVHFVTSQEIHQILCKFREGIDKEFPGLYFWMPDEALHMSLRAVNLVKRIA